MKLGKLKTVDLRLQWEHEAHNFTKWLAEPDNLNELGDALGIDIELIQTEAGVGSFSADIVAQEETTGKKIVIENQLEATDHKHLGQILTYAAGIEAEYIVWIVKDARDEHRQAVEWLNEHTDEKINFFLIRIELWQIGDSDPAPKFVIVSRPNDWTKSIRGASISTPKELTETRLIQLEFWQQLKDYASLNMPAIRLRKVYAQHWYDVAIGRSDCHACLTTLLSEKQIGCEIYIPNSKELFQAFLSNKDEIESELSLGLELSWQELPTKKACRVRVAKSFDFNSDNRSEAFDWLLQTYCKMKTVFSKDWRIKDQIPHDKS